jgi:hypothetical protein
MKKIHVKYQLVIDFHAHRHAESPWFSINRHQLIKLFSRQIQKSHAPTMPRRRSASKWNRSVRTCSPENSPPQFRKIKSGDVQTGAPNANPIVPQGVIAVKSFSERTPRFILNSGFHDASI